MAVVGSKRAMVSDNPFDFGWITTAMIPHLMRWMRSKPKQPALRIDACILYNELDLLTLRLEELWNHVDFFIVVEHDVTHSGQPKPLFFREHASRFKKYESKLIYRAITNLPLIDSETEEARFAREAVQRNSITAAVSELNLSANDIVIVCDIDEIPRSERLDGLDAMLTKYDYAIFILTNYRGYINNESELALNKIKWVGPVACRVKTLMKVGAQQVRRGNSKAGGSFVSRSKDYAYVENGGWHFSSLGGPDAFWLKAANFCHIEDPYRVISLGDSVPEQQVFNNSLSREECRALQKRYLAHCTAPEFSPMQFDQFVIPQDLAEFMYREKERFRGFFFFTDLVE